MIHTLEAQQSLTHGYNSKTMTSLTDLDKDCIFHVAAYLSPRDIKVLLTVSKSVNVALLGHGTSPEDHTTELAHLLASSSLLWSPRGIEDAIPTLIVKASTWLPPGRAQDLVTKSLCAVAARARGTTLPLSPSALETACLAGGLNGAAMFCREMMSRTSYRVYSMEDKVEEMKRCLIRVTRNFKDTTHLLVDKNARRSMRSAFDFPAPNDDETAPRFRVLVNALLTFYSSPDALLSARVWQSEDCRVYGNIDCIQYLFARRNRL